MSGMAMLVRVLRCSFLLYVSLAVLYTTNGLVAPILQAVLPSASFPRNFGFSFYRMSGFAAHLDAVQASSPSAENSRLNFLRNMKSPHVLYWGNKTGSIPMEADLFLSKAFANSYTHSSSRSTEESRLIYGNSDPNIKIVPYHYRAFGSFDKEDITLTTLVTRNRFPVLKQLVERYRGPISVTVHVPVVSAAEGEIQQLLDGLHALYTSSPLFPRFVDVHLAHSRSQHDRQFNAWRNAARMFARTDFVMMLDVDFVPCTDFRGRIRRSLRASAPGTRERRFPRGRGGVRASAAHGPAGAGDTDVVGMLRAGTAAFVVPAFEFTNHSEGLDQRAFPTSKQELAVLYNASRVAMFHRDWAPGHQNSDYARFMFGSEPGDVYRADGYQHAYEPYVIFKREGVPWCDERFVGYGGNKAACLFEMHLAGLTFYILSDDFLVHQSHAYEEEARKAERRYNRKVYADFREEMCLKYLKSYLDQGLLESPIARNAREECKKMKTLSRIVAEMIEGGG